LLVAEVVFSSTRGKGTRLTGTLVSSSASFGQGVDSILRSLSVRVVLTKKPRVVPQVKTLVSIIDIFFVVNDAFAELIFRLVILKNLFEGVLRDCVAVGIDFEAVLECDEALHVKALGRVMLKAFHDDLVHNVINRFFCAIKL